MSKTIEASEELYEELQEWPKPRQRMLLEVLRGLHRPQEISAQWLDQLPPQAAARLEVEAARRYQEALGKNGPLPQGVFLSGESARRVAGDFLLMKVGNLLGAETPSLETTDPPQWVVPVILTNPQVGRVGEVGTLRVNAQTGELEVKPHQIEEIQGNAETLFDAAA